jgi:Tol biopolymer transport system component
MRSLGVLLVCLVPARLAAQDYTIAFNSFGPANTDIFIADRNGGNPRAFLTHPSLDHNASFSSDGEWVIFTSERDGSADIFRARLDGSAMEQLVGDRAFDDQAAMSPDGSSIAFVSSRSGQADVWVMDLATRSVRNLTSAPSGEFRPAWSPDGRWIAFVSDRDPPRTSCVGSRASTGPGLAPFITPQYTAIFVVGADGSDLRRISDTTEVAGSPAWSADGSELMFYSAVLDEVCAGGLMFATGTSQIVAIDFATRERTTITRGKGVKLFPRAVDATTIGYVTLSGLAFTREAGGVAGQFGRPAWSSNGRTMVFHRDVGRRGDPGYTVIPKASRDAQFALLATPGHTSFSPDGRRIVFGFTNFEAGPSGSGVLTIANADGSAQTVIFEGPSTDNLTGPAWSPRGDAIVFGLGAFFRRAGAGPARLMTIRPDGSALTPLTDGTTNDGMPSWSPDGSELVFRVADGADRGLYILEPTTGKRRKLSTGSDRDTFPYWSPRGDWITFTSQRDGNYEIYRITPAGTDLRRLTRFAGHDAHSSISPDGEWIAFVTSQQGFKDEALGLIVGARPSPFQSYGEIAVMRIDGSDVRLLTDNSVEEGVPVWAPRPNR